MRPAAFFTSYGGRKVDRRHVLRFHADLEEAVRLHSDDDAFGVSGPFLDPGGHWRADLARHCATARTLVVLLSDVQLDSVWCAREWWIFEERVRLFRPLDDPPHSILPLVWRPLSRPMPRVVRDRQRLDWIGPLGHADEGLLDTMHTDPRSYQALCFRLGRAVARAAARPLPALPSGAAASAPPAWDAVHRRAGGDPDVGGAFATSGDAGGTDTSARPPTPPPTGSGHRDPLNVRVALALSGIEALSEDTTWRGFLRSLGRLRGARGLYPRHWPVTEPARRRMLRLVDHLFRQHRADTAITWLSRAVYDTTGDRAAATALLALLPDPTTGRSAEP
ncbi:toll/interleukin-1 receptor domain-containing protein [Nocardiopsis sp. MG754419]|uniref:toll/interleukin-1 receptor domain-containing protein n=1 Tax=Nocardiopsis sp. MG754419 TaxID=2259865 RepID=UPI001BAB5615|nr:toll/interleukin-1 receptor domain-containing protein [Nocardiopsis sp. MG754419]